MAPIRAAMSRKDGQRFVGPAKIAQIDGAHPRDAISLYVGIARLVVEAMRLVEERQSILVARLEERNARDGKDDAQLQMRLDGNIYPFEVVDDRAALTQVP
jgi:hypothetical protein